MRKDTEFNFGWNVAGTMNADELPWNQPKGALDGDRKNDVWNGPSPESTVGHGVPKSSATKFHTWNCDCAECELLEITCNQIKKMVWQLTETVRKAHRMDLSGYRGKEKRPKFENRDWLSADDLPKNGPKKFKIDDTRDAKKNKTGALVYVDLSAGKLKRTLSLRKGFTLDNFVDELGPKTEKWKGKSIELCRGGSEGQYVNVAM